MKPSHEPVVIGLTGGIGSGKTTVSNLFARHGIEVVDADEVARQVVAPGKPLLKQLANTFGEDVLQADGSLNRARLRELAFTSNERKAQLNALMHPVIREQLLHQLAVARSPYVLLSAPLLLENNLDRYCQRVLVIDLPEASQKARTLARDQVSAAQIETIMASQCSRTERLQRADDVIDNSGSADLLKDQVNRLHQKYLAIAKAG